MATQSNGVYGLYGYLAPVLGSLFFPSNDPFTSLMAVFGVFAATGIAASRLSSSTRREGLPFPRF